VWEAEWEALARLYPTTIPIKVCYICAVMCCRGPRRYFPCGESTFIHTTLRRGGQMTCIGQDVLETDPAVCMGCRSERLEHERLARLAYEDAVIWGMLASVKSYDTGPRIRIAETMRVSCGNGPATANHDHGK
jgi:hypothetical protein